LVEGVSEVVSENRRVRVKLAIAMVGPDGSRRQLSTMSYSRMKQ
jgi:hypothetical protein